ncbi:MAG TPA: FtsX-like permease family protein [Streptosporangiaceae bacterium]|nr:FtsX-like permease family protein [Streptosporangiaceae bacterium]
MRRVGRPAAAWWRALTGSASAAAAALGLLIGLCTLLAVVGPRAAAELRTSALRQLVAATLATDKAVIGTVTDSALGVGQPLGLDAGLIGRTKDQLRRNLLTLPLSPAAADWSSLTTPLLAVTGYGPAAMSQLPPEVELSYRDVLARNVRVIAGRLPGATAGSGSTLFLQTAVTQATARRFGVRVGSQLPLPGTSIVLVVTGIVQPRDPAAPFWTVDPVVAAPQLQNAATHPFWLGGFFIAAGAVRALQSQVNPGRIQVTWMFPLAIGQLTAAQAVQLQSTLTGALDTAGHITVRSSQGTAPIPVAITLSSGTSQLISGFEAEAGSVASVLDLLSVSLAVLAAVAVLLAGWLLAEQRRQDFAMLRARGASRRQLALTVFRATAVTAVPGAVAGAAVAVAVTPASPVPLSWWLAGPVVVAALAGPVLVTVRTHRGYAALIRPDAPPARLSAIRRLVIEAGLLLGAAGGLLVLRDQGGGAGGDIYASAAPALLAIGVAVIVLRVYPLLVRGVLRLHGRHASAATFLGLARASRATAAAALPAFALVLALAVVSFAGMVRGAVVTGQVAASWQQAGADAVISEPGTVSAALQRAVAAVPGVQHLAAVGVTTVGVAGGGQLDVLAVDPEQYAALVAGTPLPQPPPAFMAKARAGTIPALTAPVPALAAPGLAAALGSGSFGVLIAGYYVQLRVVGQAASMSALPFVSNGYLVLSRQALGDAAPPPSSLLVEGPDLNQAALRAAVARHAPGGTVVFRSALVAGLEDAPLQHGAVLAITLGGAAAGLCGLLVLVLSLLLSAPARELALARMSTMGLSATQGRVLGLVELAPQLLAVLAGGLACAAALVPLTGPALGLSVFTGSAGEVPVRVEPAWLVAAGAGLVVLAAVTVAGQAMLTDKNAARSLRIGE